MENITDFIIIGLALVISTIAGFITKSKLIEKGVSEPVAEEAKEIVEEAVNEGFEIISKKRGRPKKLVNTFIIFLIIPFIASCSLISSLWESEASKFHITYDRLSPSQAPIDSLVINSKASYLVFEESEIKDGLDYTFNKLGGSFWILKTNGKYRIEFTPKDTIIRIYKGK